MRCDIKLKIWNAKGILFTPGCCASTAILLWRQRTRASWGCPEFPTWNSNMRGGPFLGSEHTGLPHVHPGDRVCPILTHAQPNQAVVKRQKTSEAQQVFSRSLPRSVLHQSTPQASSMSEFIHQIQLQTGLVSDQSNTLETCPTRPLSSTYILKKRFEIKNLKLTFAIRPPSQGRDLFSCVFIGR